MKRTAEEVLPATVKHDAGTRWRSVSEDLPPDGVWVETKIEDRDMGSWCLVRRYRSEGVWRDADGKWSDRPPTHWHR